MITDEARYKIIKLVEANPAISQRELASQLGISLGKVNYCMKALVEVGVLKINNFRNSQNKHAYMYLLTPAGIEEKAIITKRFLQLKIQEYENLQAEIKCLREDIKTMEVPND